MLNLFNSIKIDKLNLTCEKRRIEPDTRHVIAKELKRYFPDATISKKYSYIFQRFTPTKLWRGKGEVIHNLQMPEEKNLKEVLWNIALQDTELLEAMWDTEIHLAKDFLLPKQVQEYIVMLANKPYSRLIPEIIESNGGICALYLHYDTDVNLKNHPKFLIKFYDKVEEYYRRHNTYIAKLYEPPSNEDRKKLGRHYNSKNNTIDLKGLNWLRIEVEFHETPQILRIAKCLYKNAERLNLTYILLKEGLYNTLDCVFEAVLKEKVFTEKENKEDVLKGVSGYGKEACEFVIKDDKFYTYKALFKEVGLEGQFSEIASLVKKIKPETALYDELYRELFPDTTSSRLIQNDWFIEKSAFCTPKVLKRYALSYLVPIWDDS